MCRAYPTRSTETAVARHMAPIVPRCRDLGRRLSRQLRSAWGLLGVLAWSSLAGAVEPIRATTQSIRLGESEVAVVTTQTAGSRRCLYVNLHDDENTSVEAVREVLGNSGGRLVELSHGGRRNLAFTLAGERYRVDPNRIFTAAGVRATLEKQSRYTADAAPHRRAIRQRAAEGLPDRPGRCRDRPAQQHPGNVLGAQLRRRRHLRGRRRGRVYSQG